MRFTRNNCFRGVLFASLALWLLIPAATTTAATVGYWPFDTPDGAVLDDTTPDESDNDNVGTFGKKATINSDSMIGSGAASFVGANHYTISMGPNSGASAVLFPTSGFTVAAWVKPTLDGADLGRTVATAYGKDKIDDANLDNGWMLGMRSTGGPFGMYFYAPDGSDRHATDSDFFTNNLNEWTHIAGVFDPSSAVRFYVNGAEAAANTTDIPAAATYDQDGKVDGDPQEFRVGMQSAWNLWFEGQIDDLAVFDSVLSAGQIGSLADQSRTPLNVEIPEPASAILIAMGALGLLGIRRRWSQ